MTAFHIFRENFAKTRRERFAYFRSMRASRLAVLATAAFFLFANLGLISSLLGGSATHLFGGLAWAAISGFLAAFYLVITARRRSMLPMLVLALALVNFTMRRLSIWIDHTYPEISFNHAVHVYAWLALVCTILSYSLFVLFIQTEGKKALRAHTELDLAYSIQKTLAPIIQTSLAGCEFYGVSLPSDRVGGDIVDVVTLNGEDAFAYVADISGHGLQAGIFMGMVKAAVRSLLLTAQDPGKLFQDLNSVLPGLKESQMYATCAALKLTRRRGGPVQITYAIAGHPPFMHFKAAEHTISQLGDAQFPIGLLSFATYERNIVTLLPGDLLVSVTDGILEVQNPEEVQFGISRVEEVLAEHSTTPLGELAQFIISSARSWGVQDDDQTILLIRASNQAAPGREPSIARGVAERLQRPKPSDSHDSSKHVPLRRLAKCASRSIHAARICGETCSWCAKLTIDST